MKKTLVSAGIVVLLGGCGTTPVVEPQESVVQKPRGFVQLIEFHDDIQGLRNWAHALDVRGMKSLVNVQKAILDEYPEDIHWLADHGHEVMGLFAGGPVWDVPYEEQLEGMREAKEAVESVTGKPMRVFSSGYFAYDENTLRAAEELGVEYILARGTSDVEALIYEPDEYSCKIISVSNVTFADMGRGSLCDYSLYARGATAAEFGYVLDETLEKYPKRLMVVSHAYLGGMKAAWWEPYEELLDSGAVEWVATFDEWVKPENGANIGVPLSMVPDNREVEYTTPTPAVPLDELEDVDDMYNPCAAP